MSTQRNYAQEIMGTSTLSAEIAEALSDGLILADEARLILGALNQREAHSEQLKRDLIAVVHSRRT